MAEAQPAKRRGGHTYGRRNLELSNTAEEGELCLYIGHSLGRFSSKSMRFDSHQACTRCVAAAREGRMSLDLDKLIAKERKRALKFWAQVEIGDPQECWNWGGCINERTEQPQFAWRRSGISSSTQHHPQRVAMWYSWGDLGYTGVKTTCGNKYCCNPFHLIPQKIGVFVDHDSYLESFEMQCQIHTLKQRVQEYLIEEAMKAQEQMMKQAELDERAALMFDPSAQFGERFEATIGDVLAGRHSSQHDPDDPTEFKKPVDNEENSTDNN